MNISYACSVDFLQVDFRRRLYPRRRTGRVSEVCVAHWIGIWHRALCGWLWGHVVEMSLMSTLRFIHTASTRWNVECMSYHRAQCGWSVWRGSGVRTSSNQTQPCWSEIKSKGHHYTKNHCVSNLLYPWKYVLPGKWKLLSGIRMPLDTTHLKMPGYFFSKAPLTQLATTG